LSFFNSQDTESWILLPTEVEKTCAVLLNVPQFSEHTITISSIADVMSGLTAFISYMIIFIVVAIVIVAPIVFIDRKEK